MDVTLNIWALLRKLKEKDVLFLRSRIDSHTLNFISVNGKYFIIFPVFFKN